MNSIHLRIFNCIEKTLGSPIASKDIQKHLHFDYGLDSLSYQKLAVLLEDEFEIEIPEDIGKSGYFSSVEGIATLFKEFYVINDI